WKVLATRLRDFGADVPGLPDSVIAIVAECRRIEGAAGVLEPGSIRHRMGWNRRGDGLLSRGAELRQDAHPVRQTDRVVSDGAGEAGLDDPRDHQGAVVGAADRAAEGFEEGAAPPC